ncbi:hypothetical protein D3C86_2077060 [compost metagenome]
MQVMQRGIPPLAGRHTGSKEQRNDGAAAKLRQIVGRARLHIVLQPCVDVFVQE